MKCDNCGKECDEIYTGGTPEQHLCEDCVDAILEERIAWHRKYTRRINCEDLDLE